MFGAGYETTVLTLARAGGAIVLAGLAVKLMDDFMDLRMDAQFGVPSVAVRLGEATLPYTLLLLAMAALLDVRLALALFLASYAVGMAGDLNRMLPSGLTGWQEGLIAVGFGAVFAGPLVQLWAVAVMGFVQCVDDMVDTQHDAWTGSANLVRRWGLGEIRLAALGTLMIAVLTDPILTSFVVFAVALIEALVWRVALQRTGPGVGSVPRGWLE